MPNANREFFNVRDNAQMAKSPEPKRWKPTRLRAWREWRGLTLLQMATDMPYNEGTLSEIEKGNKRYNQDVLERAARVLDIPPQFILSRPPPPKGTPLDPNDPEVVAWRIDTMDGDRRKRVVDRFKDDEAPV